MTKLSATWRIAPHYEFDSCLRNRYAGYQPLLILKVKIMATTMDFESCKRDWLRIALLLAKASSAEELAALLVADTQAPYHSFDSNPFYIHFINLGEALGMAVIDSAAHVPWGDEQEQQA